MRKIASEIENRRNTVEDCVVRKSRIGPLANQSVELVDGHSIVGGHAADGQGEREGKGVGQVGPVYPGRRAGVAERSALGRLPIAGIFIAAVVLPELTHGQSRVEFEAFRNIEVQVERQIGTERGQPVFVFRRPRYAVGGREIFETVDEDSGKAHGLQRLGGLQFGDPLIETVKFGRGIVGTGRRWRSHEQNGQEEHALHCGPSAGCPVAA